MSARKKGSRLTDRDTECFLCNKIGKHELVQTNKGLKVMCQKCKAFIEKNLWAQ